MSWKQITKGSMEDWEGFCYFLPKSKGMDSGNMDSHASHVSQRFHRMLAIGVWLALITHRSSEGRKQGKHWIASYLAMTKPEKHWKG